MPNILLYIIFFVPFLLEGFGIKQMHQLTPYYYLLLPAILYFYTVIKKTKLVFPLYVSLIFLLFLFFTLISTLIFSVDKQVSFGLTLFYIACFFIFVFFYNHKKEGESLISSQIMTGAIIFIIYSLSLSFLKKIDWNLFNPFHGYQFVTSNFASHNHLGDLLGLTILLSLFLLLSQRKFSHFFIFLIALPFFLFSFSRSAYLAFLIILFVFFIQKKFPKIILTVFIVISFLTSIFFLVTVREAQTSDVFKPLHTFLKETVNLQPKDFLGQRIEYFNQGLKSFYDKPLFGVGVGNYGFISTKYIAGSNAWTDTAHNLFLEILVENGLFSLIFFALLILFILKSGYKNKSIYFFLFLYLLLNFQTDYTYNIYSFFMIFIILMALVYEERQSWSLRLFYPISALLLFLTIDLLFAVYLLIMKLN